MTNSSHNSKLLTLGNILTPLLEEGLIIAFSGGVDSSFLLWAAKQELHFINRREKQGRLAALLTVSPSIPDWEVQEAKKFAESLKVMLVIRNSYELEQASYAKNDGTRCYYCKSELFKIANQEAAKLGYPHIAYGYNASDRKDIRWGHKAAQENNIYAPLDKAGLEKQEIRNILKQVGLSLADKPASPCLASRIMTGVRVTEEKLQHVQRMEIILRSAGLREYRVRLHEEQQIRYFRIEVVPEEMKAVLDIRSKLIAEAAQMGYRWVNLDLAGYKMGGGNLPSW